MKTAAIQTMFFVCTLMHAADQNSEDIFKQAVLSVKASVPINQKKNKPKKPQPELLPPTSMRTRQTAKKERLAAWQKVWAQYQEDLEQFRFNRDLFYQCFLPMAEAHPDYEVTDKTFEPLRPKEPAKPADSMDLT